MGDRFKKHINVGESIEVDGETFVLLSLGTEHAGDFFKIQKYLLPLYQEKKKSGEEIDMMTLFSGMPDEFATIAARLTKRTLEVSYPDEDKKDLDVFAAKYMWQLFGAVMKVNSAAQNLDSERKKELLAKL